VTPLDRACDIVALFASDFQLEIYAGQKRLDESYQIRFPALNV